MPNREHILQRQAQRLEFRLARLQEMSQRTSHVRMAIILLGIPLIWAAFRFGGNQPGWGVVIAVAGAFAAALTCHARTRDSIYGHEVWRDLKLGHLARLRLDWERIPPVPPPAAPAEHPFGADLDITGERSLHHLVDTSVSLEGSRKVLSWLMDTEPDVREILRRQALVRELEPLTLFRGKLAVHAQSGSKGSRERRLDADRLLQWLQKRRVGAPAGRVWLSLTVALALSNLALLGLSASGILPPHPFVILFFVYLGMLLLLQIEIRKAFGDAMTIEATLNGLLAVFRHLETFRYAHTPHLARLCAPFLDTRGRPSAQLRRISRIVAAISVRSNPIIWLLLNAVLPWDVIFVRQLERCKVDMARFLPLWLDVLTEVEALGSLANFAHLHPDTTFPEFEAASGRRGHEGAHPGAPLLFHAERLGHPLIPADRRVCNDFTFDEDHRIAIITGSNMAGKSSLLRTIGINLCLAYAGAPVCAVRLRTGIFRIFTSMRVSDSLTDGFSFFYAEVKRLKMLLTATEADGAPPILFLLDEIFRGTNNQERFIGSRAYIRALAGRAAVGAIATHDLELARLAEENAAIANYHFREEVADGRMVFDYRLRPGPCPTTNALKIMAMAGLPV